MTQQEIVDHWRKGAQDAFDAACVLEQKEKYALALFHCHLAIEKALKALYIQKFDGIPPKTHDLLQLLEKLTLSLNVRQRELLDELSDFVTLENDPRASRYFPRSRSTTSKRPVAEFARIQRQGE